MKHRIQFVSYIQFAMFFVFAVFAVVSFVAIFFNPGHILTFMMSLIMAVAVYREKKW